MKIIELYSSITEENTVAQDNVQSDYDNVLDDVAMNRAEIQRIADLQDHTAYQVAEIYKLINTLKYCGVDRSILFMYNKNNELSELSGVVLPSLEDYDNGSRVSDKDIDTMISNICAHAGIISMEGIIQNNTYAQALVDEIARPFRAGWRWFQSMSEQPTKLAERIEGYLENLKANKRTKLSGNAELIEFNTLKNHLTNKTTTYRNEANKLIKDLNEGRIDLEESVNSAKRMREIRDEVKSDIADIKKSVNSDSRVSTDLSRINISDYIKLGEQTIDRLKKISNMNKTYDGFWATEMANTHNQNHLWNINLSLWLNLLLKAIGKSNILVATPWLASVYIHRGVISTESVGWQVLTLTVDSDMILARAVAHNLKEINDAVK